MKRAAFSIFIYMLCVTAPAGAVEKPAPAPDPAVSYSQRVVTALDHLTVLEYDEPVVQAAAGSSVFQIERQDSKVFIKPTKAGATTNLFIWTASHQTFSYELSVGDVTNMNTEIHIPVARPHVTAAADDSNVQMDQVADMVITRTLLGTEAIDSAGIKTLKNRVCLRIQQVFRSRTSLYIQYSIENQSGRSYRITNPNLYEIQVEHARVNLPQLKSRQLDPKIIEEFGTSRQIPLTIVHADIEAQDLAPGQRQQGIIAIRRQHEPGSPLVVRLAFDPNVTATAVF